MRRGTTPTVTIRVCDVDISLIETAILTFRQKVRPLIQFDKEPVISGANTMSVSLTQEETFALRTDAPVEIQLRAKLFGGKIIASNIATVSVGDVLNEVIL